MLISYLVLVWGREAKTSKLAQRFPPACTSLECGFQSSPRAGAQVPRDLHEPSHPLTTESERP